MSERQRVTFGPFTGGINRAVDIDRLSAQELHDATGVFTPDRGALSSCFETSASVVSFPNTSVTATGSHYVPYRVIYWEDEGKTWQLYGADSTGATSIRREDLDRSYGDYDCTAAVYRGLLFLCGSGETAFALSTTWSCNVRVLGTTFSYNSASGVVSSPTFTSGSGYNLLAGDVFVVSGSRYTVSAVTQSTGAFTISTGSTFATGDFYIERVRPIYLAESYSEQDGVATMVYGQTTFSSTTNAGLATNSYIAFSVASTWSMADSKFHPRSYQISSFTGSGASWTVTLTDAYEGTAGTASYRVSGTGLSIALPFVYQDRLCAVGASSTNSDYNVIYNSGYPGQASPTVKDDDIFDFMYWDLTNTAYPIGLNAGAIQRVEPLADRAIVFCQNAVYEWRGVLPVDALLGSSMQDRPIAPGIGATTYDSVAVGPDRQTVFFGGPDGIFKVYGFNVDPIDTKIRTHELYTTGMQWAAYHDNRVYFTDGTDYPDSFFSPQYSHLTVRGQAARIWIYDLLSQEWYLDQRLDITDAEPLYIIGRHGGVFSPYRNALVADDTLLVSRPAGLARLNYLPDLVRGRPLGLIQQHQSRIVFGNHPDAGRTLKKVRLTTINAQEFGTNQVVSYGFTPYDAPTSIQTFSSVNVPTAVGGGGKGDTSLSMCIGWNIDRTGSPYGVQTFVALSDQDEVLSDNISGTYSFVGAASTYLVYPLVGTPFYNYTASNYYRIAMLYRYTAITASGTATIHFLDSSFSSLGSATVTGTPAITTDHYFYWAEVNATGTVAYVGLELSSGMTVEMPYHTESGYSILTASGGTSTSVVSNAQPFWASYSPQGNSNYIRGLDAVDVDFISMPGRKR